VPTRQGSAGGEDQQHGDQREPDRDRGGRPAGNNRSAPNDVDPEDIAHDGWDHDAENGDVETGDLDHEPPQNGGPQIDSLRNGKPRGNGRGTGPGPRGGAAENGAARTDSAKLAGRASAQAAVAAGAAEDEDTAPGTRTPDLTAAAFFDVDNTMMMGASLFHFARGMAARKFFTASDLAGFAWQQFKFRVGGRENPQDVRSSSEQALSFVAGRKVTELVDLSEEIYDELMADRIWDGTRALAQHHLDRGQRVWLVTATPVELAQIIARRLGLTGALGTVAESSRGVYTGRLVGEMLHGRAKAHAVRALAASEGLDLRRCTAYSDSANDVPMLSAVGTAVAVNPDQRLRDIARARDWQVRDFRTGRKAARIGMHTALGAGAVAGAVAAGLRYHRR
jgi:HAD superfamily hydrolase (TIGR01490 family)